MSTVKDVTEYKSIRQWLMAEFEAKPRTVITLDELIAHKSGWTPRQIRASIANLRHEKRHEFPLRVAGTEPRSEGRPGSPTATAWIYEPSGARRFANAALPEPDEVDDESDEVDDESDTDVSTNAALPEHSATYASEGYRWTPYENTNGNGGRRRYEELAVTKVGVMLVEDNEGKVYRLMEVDL